MKKEALLEVQDIHKNFGNVQALKGVSIAFMPGEVHGLIGENGSGKSTLSSVISGIYKGSGGKMFLEGRPYVPESVLDGERNGIRMIVQEMGTISGITVAANIFAGKENLFSRYGIVNKKAMVKAAGAALAHIGVSDIKADGKIDDESFENRKIVEIARAKYQEIKVLIVDETTTALSQRGRKLIYELMARLKEEGKAVIFISHDLDELTLHCDTVTVLRDGEYIATLSKEEIAPDKMRQLMVGRQIQDDHYRGDYGMETAGEPVLEATDLTLENRLENITFKLRKGEILGVGGLTDSGMHELGKVVFGIEKPDGGLVS